MSIATQIFRLQKAKADLKSSIKNKGVEVDDSALISDYAGLVDQISGGITPTGEIEITENGQFDVTNFASALVNVEAILPIRKIASGEIILTSPANTIPVTYNFGETPDMIRLWGDYADANEIPSGCCIESSYCFRKYGSGSNIATTPNIYMYQYKHPTSGNIFGGNYADTDTVQHLDTFNIRRGGYSFASVKTDGITPVKYRWVAVLY